MRSMVEGACGAEPPPSRCARHLPACGGGTIVLAATFCPARAAQSESAALHNATAGMSCGGQNLRDHSAMWLFTLCPGAPAAGGEAEVVVEPTSRRSKPGR